MPGSTRSWASGSRSSASSAIVERVRAVLVRPQQERRRLDQPVGVEQVDLRALRPAAGGARPRPHAVAVAADAHERVADQVARGGVARARSAARPCRGGRRARRACETRAVQARAPRRRAARPRSRAPAGRAADGGASRWASGRARRGVELAGRRSRAAAAARPPRGRRPAAAARTRRRRSRRPPRPSTPACRDGAAGPRSRRAAAGRGAPAGSGPRAPRTSGSHSRWERNFECTQRERRPGPRLAVGDPRAVVVVVEPQLHAAADASVDRRAAALTLRPRDPRASRCPRSARWRPSRCTCSSTRRSSGTSARRSWRRSRSPRPCSPRAFTIFNFLTYGTTAHVARLHGAGREDEAALVGSQALWLGAVHRRRDARARPRRSRSRPRRSWAARARSADDAALYLRIAALGAPFFMLAAAGQGYLRGIVGPAHAARDPVVAHVVNVVLELLFVYGFDWGLAGSAWGTVIAQVGHGRGVRAASSGAPAGRGRRWRAIRPLMRIGSAHRRAHGRAARRRSSSPRAVLARVGAPSLGAHQIAFQLWVFLALVLDALAIAAQVMVGRMLGAGDAAGARAASRRIIGVVGRGRRGVRRRAARARRPAPARVHRATRP